MNENEASKSVECKNDENADEEKDCCTNLVSISRIDEGTVNSFVRSKSMPPTTVAAIRKHNKSDMATIKQPSSLNLNNDRLKIAKEEAERAIKV